MLYLFLLILSLIKAKDLNTIIKIRYYLIVKMSCQTRLSELKETTNTFKILEPLLKYYKVNDFHQ